MYIYMFVFLCFDH